MEWRHGITVLNSTALQQLFITFKWGWLYTKSILNPSVPIQTIQSLLPVSAQSNCAHDTYPIPWLPSAIPCFYQLLAQPNLHSAFVTLVQSQDRQTARVKARAASGAGHRRSLTPVSAHRLLLPAYSTALVWASQANLHHWEKSQGKSAWNLQGMVFVNLQSRNSRKRYLQNKHILH